MTVLVGPELWHGKSLRFARLVLSESRKELSSRTLVAIIILSTVGSAVFSWHYRLHDALEVAVHLSSSSLLSFLHSEVNTQIASSQICIFGAVLGGAIIGSLEWRCRTWPTSLLSTPSRLRLLSGKAISALLYFWTLALVSCLASVCVALVGFSGANAALAEKGLGERFTIATALHLLATYIGPLLLACGVIGILWMVVASTIRIQALVVLLGLISSVGIARWLAATHPYAARWLPIWAVQGFAKTTPSLSFGSFAIRTVGRAQFSVSPLSAGTAIFYLVSLVFLLAALRMLAFRRITFR